MLGSSVTYTSSIMISSFRNPSLSRLFMFSALILLQVFLDGCSDRISEEKEDVERTLEEAPFVEPIASVLSVAIVDYDTKDHIETPVTLVFNSHSQEHTTNEYAEIIDSVVFSGGVYNIGIKNATTPTPENPLKIVMTVSAEGYYNDEVGVTISDTGVTHFDLKMFSVSKPPINFSSTNIDYSVDTLFDSPEFKQHFDSLQAASQQSISGGRFGDSPGNRILNQKSVETDSINVLVNAFFLPISDSTEVHFRNLITNQSSSFTGPPKGYIVLAYSWIDVPELVRAYHDDLNPDKDFMTLFELFKVIVINPSNPNNFTNQLAYFEKPSGKGRGRFVTFSIDNPYNIIAETYLSNFLSNSKDSRLRLWTMFSPVENPKDYKSLEQYITYLPRINYLQSWGNPWLTVMNNASNGKPVISIIGENDLTTPSTVFNFSQITVSASGQNKIEFFNYYPQVWCKIYSLLKTGIVNISIQGYGSSSTMEVEILSGGQTKFGSDTNDDGRTSSFKNIPLTNANITVQLPEGKYTINKDLSGYNGETITINVPSRSSGLIDGTMIGKVICPGTRKFPTNQIPSSSLRFRKKGTSGPWQVGTVKKWYYTYKLDSVAYDMPGIILNTKYDVKFSVAGNSAKYSFEADSSKFYLDLNIPGKYCF